MKNKTKLIIVIISFVFALLISILIAELFTILIDSGENSDEQNVSFSENSEEQTANFGENLVEENEEFGENSGTELIDENGNLDETQNENPPTLVKTQPIESDNCSTSFGELMLINPNFTVTTNYIAARKSQLVNITELYGIKEGNEWNGVPLLDPEAAVHLNEMLNDYKKAYQGHEITTRSCFRSEGTNCGRLCYATGTSDHHTGYTCDLIDDAYGGMLDTEYLESHPEWVWLHENSYKYGFIDRFISEWAGGSMSEPVNLTADGTTGLYETWHYRYVGKTAAKEIATGKYNNGNYDSLEHYLLSSGKIKNLFKKDSCKN